MLAEITTWDEVNKIPVVILTSSEAETDIHKSFSLYANSYLLKPIDADRFDMVVQSLAPA